VIDPSIGAGENGSFRADLAAGIALNAAVGEKGDLLPCVMGFRVVAPGTSKGTPLEEENRSDSRPVVKAEPLDIKDQGLSLAGFLGRMDYSVAHDRSSCILDREDIQRTERVGPANRLLHEKKESAPQLMTLASSEDSMTPNPDSVNNWCGFRGI